MHEDPMPDATRETTERPGQARPARQPYSSPRLEVLGSLRRATRGSGGMGADGALGMTRMSDRRAKEDIVEIGRHPLGLGIYRFRYTSPYSMKYGSQRRVGVMADEVAVKYPFAVSCDAGGHLMVDYGQLFR
jgi:hypothetical protein